jgi:hypothetical protein
VDIYHINAESSSSVPLDPFDSYTQSRLGIGLEFCPTVLHVGYKSPDVLYVGSDCQGMGDSSKYIVQI